MQARRRNGYEVKNRICSEIKDTASAKEKRRLSVCQKTYIAFKNGVWGVAPMRVVSRWCRCVVQRLCATDCKRPCLVRAAAPHSARQGRRACMPKGSMQGRIQVVVCCRCRTHRQQTTTVAQMQSQPSIHSPSPRGRGLGFRQGCRDKTPKGFAGRKAHKAFL